MLEIITRNWPLKLLAVSLAFAIWIAVTGEERLLKDFDVPLAVRLGKNLTLASSPPTTIMVRLSGPENRIRTIDPVGMRFTVDLSDAIPGERTVQLSESNLDGLPGGFEVDLINPARVSMTLDELSQKDLPVSATLTGQPRQGYAYYGARVSPRTITVEGPRSEIVELEEIQTDPIDLGGRSEPFVVTVGAVPASPGVRILSARSLEVRVDVDAAPVERVVDAVAVVLTGQAYESTVTPDSLRVTITGPPTLVRTIGPQHLRAVVDITGLEPR
ncbi:MAG: CdaR family protein, partial [Acidobacteriota bacterium]|nr:CdaR family protein [Acidobacteriota bacterium]